MTTQERIGQRVRHLRMELHLTGRDFAGLIGWQSDYLSRFEHGRWRHIEPDKLCQIAVALRVSADHLLGLTHGEAPASETFSTPGDWGGRGGDMSAHPQRHAAPVGTGGAHG